MQSYLDVVNIDDLNACDIIKSKATGQVYVVTGNYGTRVTAVKTVDVTNPIEWEVLRPIEISKTEKINGSN